MSAPTAALLRVRPLLRPLSVARIGVPSAPWTEAARSYVSRAHPISPPTFAIRDAVNMVLEGIEERKVKREKRWELRKEDICRRKGIQEDGPFRNQDETIELAINLNVDPRKPGQAMRGSLHVPHGTGKKRSILLFTSYEEIADAAREAGAASAGGEELVKGILDGSVPVDSFDVALATPEMMSSLSGAARLLGPRGLMPNAKVGTIHPPEKVIDALKGQVAATQVPFRSDKEGIVHAGIAKGSLGPEKILDNVRAFMEGIHDVKPESFGKGKKGGKGGKKGGGGKNAKFYLKAHITSTQGKGVMVDLRTVDPTSSFFMNELPE